MRCTLLLAALLWAAQPLSAAEIVIVNVNAPGVGFNDTRAAVPEAGLNGGATLGQQRLRVVQRAAEIWAATLDSPVPIRIEVEMIDLVCETGSVILGLGGPLYLAWNFSNAPRRDTAYPVPLANSLAGSDLMNSGNDIGIDLNLAIDRDCYASAAGWWYGLDPDVPAPADRIPLLPVVLHEIGHGLGFLSGINITTGTYPVSQPLLWANYLYDQQIGKHWRAMTPAERVTSAHNDPYLVWTGSHVNSQLSNWLLGQLRLDLRGLRGGDRRLPLVATAEFGDAMFGDGPDAVVVAVNDGVAATGDPPGTPRDGCEYPFLNGNRLAGRIALIDRGLCAFVQKARHAQQHGAIAVIIANNVDGLAPGMGGIAPDVTIPVLGVTQEEGALLRRSAPGLLRAQPIRDESLSGTREGCMRMYAPGNVSSSGSLVTHFHSDATPPLLMEPAVSRGLGEQLDLTVDLLRDLGWRMRVASPTPVANTCARVPLP